MTETKLNNIKGTGLRRRETESFTFMSAEPMFSVPTKVDVNKHACSLSPETWMFTNMHVLELDRIEGLNHGNCIQISLNVLY